MPVTRIDSFLPTSLVVTRYVRAVAPEITLPSRNHWYFVVTPDIDHVGTDAVSFSPRRALPEITEAFDTFGAAPATTFTAADVACAPS